MKLSWILEVRIQHLNDTNSATFWTIFFPKICCPNNSAAMVLSSFVFHCQFCNFIWLSFKLIISQVQVSPKQRSCIICVPFWWGRILPPWCFVGAMLLAIADWCCYFKLNVATVACCAGQPHCHRVLPRQNESCLNVVWVSSAVSVDIHHEFSGKGYLWQKWKNAHIWAQRFCHIIQTRVIFRES